MQQAAMRQTRGRHDITQNIKEALKEIQTQKVYVHEGQ